jgi:hypothetical protein
MEKAIELIMNSELKLYNISEIVGTTTPSISARCSKTISGFRPAASAISEGWQNIGSGVLDDQIK